MIKSHSDHCAERRVSCGRLSNEQAEKLHAASLDVLERTGVRFFLPEAVAKLQKAGAPVSEGNRVRIPAKLVEQALATAPSEVRMYNRQGELAMNLGGFRSYFGTGSDCLYVLDHRTGKRRSPCLADVVEAVRLCDALPNIDFVMSLFLPADCDAALTDRYQMEVMLNHTTKPIVFVTNEFSGTLDAVAMAEAVAGGADALSRKPFIGCYINVTTGLRQNEEALQKLLFLSEKNIPFTYVPVTQGGATAPITLAGSYIAMNAGVLAGLVLSQLTREGAPFIAPGQGGEALDMRTMVSPYAAPDDRPLCRAMGHYYNLPIFGLAGCSDSKLADQQAAAEAALTLMSDSVGGANLIHDVGYLESGLCGSLAQVCLCDEIIGWLRHLQAPIALDDEALAVQVIEEVGPDGHYLEHEHTFAHYKERYYPDLFERDRFENWQAKGGLSLGERAANKVARLLEEHQPEPLLSEKAKAVKAVVCQAAKLVQGNAT
jgi:trimethylamine---corrinoid protein Co-methyltransferase